MTFLVLDDTKAGIKTRVTVVASLGPEKKRDELERDTLLRILRGLGAASIAMRRESQQ